ncbi:MAG: hypothetical protein KAI17_14870 [Thiotrichaceae bacterium]|nr:hypothetical protein [Thiotrichaceae bacterium]
MLWKITIICGCLFCLLSCQASAPSIPADVIIKDAHGGGSIVKFNNSETILASGGWSGYIRLWEIPKGIKIYSWKAHEGEITGIFFSHNDKQLISTGYDGVIKIWSAQGVLIKERNTTATILTMAVDEQHNIIITGHNDGIVRIWNRSDLAPLEQRKQHSSPVRSVAFSAQTKMIASSASNSDVMLWPHSAPSIKLPSPFTDIRTLTFSQNGQVLLGGGWFNLYRWTLQDHKLQTLDTEHHGIIRSMDLLDNGATLATISRQTDSSVLFLDPKNGSLKKRFQSHQLCGTDISVSKNQNYLATTSDDSSVRIWWLNKADAPDSSE